MKVPAVRATVFPLSHVRSAALHFVDPVHGMVAKPVPHGSHT